MPDVRRRDLGDAMGQAVAGIAGGLANGGSTAITQLRDITSTDRPTRPSASGSTIAFGTERTATNTDGFTEVLESGVWLVDGTVWASWSGAVGVIEGGTENANNEPISGPYRTIDTVSMNLRIPTYRYVSGGRADDRLLIDAVQIGGSSATITWTVTATFLGNLDG